MSESFSVQREKTGNILFFLFQLLTAGGLVEGVFGGFLAVAAVAAGPTVFFLLATIIFKRSAEQESLVQGERTRRRSSKTPAVVPYIIFFFIQGGLALSLYVSVYSTFDASIE